MSRKLAAEFFGTFWLVFGGCGSAVLAAAFPQLGIGFIGVAFAFGLTVLTMAYAVGGISGGHFNPAVSLGLAIANRFEWAELIPYWIVQVIGGFAGAAVLYVIATRRGRHRRSDRQEFLREVTRQTKGRPKGRSSFSTRPCASRCLTCRPSRRHSAARPCPSSRYSTTP
jgi:glycerol uptake facilitator-like aquaporin